MDPSDSQPTDPHPYPRPDDWLICWHSRWEDKQPSPRATYGKVKVTPPFFVEKLRGCLDVAGYGYGPDRDSLGLLTLRTDSQGRIVCSLRTHPHDTFSPSADPYPDPAGHPARRNAPQRDRDTTDDGA